MDRPAALFPPVRERRFSAALLGFIALSFFGHTATFFIFQVVYPQRVTLPPPAPQVALLMPDTPEQEALLRWVDAEDPALVAATAGVEPPGLLQLEYHPSFQTLRTPPRTPPEEVGRPEQPPSSIPITFMRAPGAGPTPAPPVPQPAATTVELSGALRDRKLTEAGRLSVQAAEPLQPAQFLIALDGRGQVQFSFLQNPSGDEKADTAAAAYLESASYSPGPETLTWGMATIHWGDDAYPKNP